jgi:polar amino acid transport system substrate-binding protein
LTRDGCFSGNLWPLALLVGLLAPVQRMAAAESRALVWAADEEGGAPYVFKNPKNLHERIGFEVDLAHALEGELGRPIEFKQYQFVNLMAGLQRGDFDFAMNGVEVTPDREKVVHFTRPYYVYSLQLTARKEEQRFDSLESCRKVGGLVGTLGDTAAERLLDQMGVKKKVYDDQVAPFMDLELGRVDAVFLDLPIVIYYGQPNPKLKLVGQPRGQGFYAIALRKNQEELAAQLDAALGRLIDSGKLREIYQKWNLWNDDQQQLSNHQRLDNIIRDSARDWTFRRYFVFLLQGAVVTVEITLASMALAMLIGLPLALGRLYGPLPIRAAATVYVEFFRGIPVLLLLFFLYYGLPQISAEFGLPFTLKLEALPAAILGFGLNYAAYQAEIFRAGIRSIPGGQWEAAASLGMPRYLTFRRIIMPQAVRVILPPMTNDLVALFKDTSLVSTLAVVELTKQYQLLAKSSLKYLEIGLVTALLYLIMSVPLGYLSRYMEHRWGRGL